VFPKPPIPRATEPALLARLRQHFGTDPASLPVVVENFESFQRPNFHLTVENLLAEKTPAPVLVGMVIPEHSQGPSLSKFSRHATAAAFEEGPVEYVDTPLGDERRLACVKQGLYLFSADGQPVAMLVADASLYRLDGGFKAEVMALDRTAAERVARKIVKGVNQGAAFRGKVLSVAQDCYRRTTVLFHKIPDVRRENLILPEDLLRRIERQTMGHTKHADKLRAAGRHLKRGILMHGKPGTGKTLSAMYLAAQMPGRTVMVLTGGAMGSIETACALARLLEPATVILEDVDLIGTERHHQEVGANALLFELLNQMDGLGEDADILFILTTNRPDHLEPALAARPGRIDLAIEVPLPDEECRRRLIALYGRGLKLELADPEVWVRRTKGVSAAFIRELLRKAAVLAAEDNGTGPELVVTDRHLEEATAELLVAGGPLTKTLLGVDRNGDE
jgi:AAA+ superfamily predicted ATPase